MEEAQEQGVLLCEAGRLDSLQGLGTPLRSSQAAPFFPVVWKMGRIQRGLPLQEQPQRLTRYSAAGGKEGKKLTKKKDEKLYEVISEISCMK